MGGYLVLVIHQSLLPNFLPLAPTIISFSIKYSRNRLFIESFFEVPVQNFMIYHFVNIRTEILAIATSQIVHLCNQYNHAFIQLISMPRFNSINFYQNRPKIKLFLPPKIYKIFERWGLRPQTLVTIPPFRFLATPLLLASQQPSAILSSPCSCPVLK